MVMSYSSLPKPAKARSMGCTPTGFTVNQRGGWIHQRISVFRQYIRTHVIQDIQLYYQVLLFTNDLKKFTPGTS